MLDQEAKTYSIDDTISLPIELDDEAGIAHVRVLFWRIKNPGNLGPRGLAPDDALELRGNGNHQTHATVDATLKVSDRHVPGEYLCVSIQVYDPDGNVTVVRNPSPAKTVWIIEDDKKERPGPKFLGWRD